MSNHTEETESPRSLATTCCFSVFLSVARAPLGLLGGAQMWSARTQDDSASTSKHLREIKTLVPASVREEQGAR